MTMLIECTRELTSLEHKYTLLPLCTREFDAKLHLCTVLNVRAQGRISFTFYRRFKR